MLYRLGNLKRDAGKRLFPFFDVKEENMSSSDLYNASSSSKVAYITLENAIAQLLSDQRKLQEVKDSNRRTLNRTVLGNIDERIREVKLMHDTYGAADLEDSLSFVTIWKENEHLYSAKYTEVLTEQDEGKDITPLFLNLNLFSDGLSWMNKKQQSGQWGMSILDLLCFVEEPYIFADFQLTFSQFSRATRGETGGYILLLICLSEIVKMARNARDETVSFAERIEDGDITDDGMIRNIIHTASNVATDRVLKLFKDEFEKFARGRYGFGLYS